MGLGMVLGLSSGLMDLSGTRLEMEYFWVVFFKEFWGSWKIKVLEQNHTKKHVFSTVDFNGIFKGRNTVILKVLVFTCLVLGC